MIIEKETLYIYICDCTIFIVLLMPISVLYHDIYGNVNALICNFCKNQSIFTNSTKIYKNEVSIYVFCTNA